MVVVIKKSRDGKREYYYDQKSVKVNGKVKTTSIYVGPVNPKKKKRDGVGFFIMGGLALGLAAAKGELKSHKQSSGKGGRHPRSIMVEREQWEEKRAREYRDWHETEKLPKGVGAKTGLTREELLKNASQPRATQEERREQLMKWAGVPDQPSQPAPQAAPSSPAPTEGKDQSQPDASKS